MSSSAGSHRQLSFIRETLTAKTSLLPPGLWAAPPPPPLSLSLFKCLFPPSPPLTVTFPLLHTSYQLFSFGAGQISSPPSSPTFPLCLSRNVNRKTKCSPSVSDLHDMNSRNLLQPLTSILCRYPYQPLTNTLFFYASSLH